MFTPSQVSNMLTIPASTLRRYAVLFADHLSPTGNRKNRRRDYTQTDILTFQRIRDMIGQGLSTEEIAARLPLVDNAPASNNALALVPEIAARFESLAASVARLPELENQIATLAELVQSERAARLALENELREYRDTPWYKRVFRR